MQAHTQRHAQSHTHMCNVVTSLGAMRQSMMLLKSHTHTHASKLSPERWRQLHQTLQPRGRLCAGGNCTNHRSPVAASSLAATTPIHPACYWHCYGCYCYKQHDGSKSDCWSTSRQEICWQVCGNCSNHHTALPPTHLHVGDDERNEADGVSWRRGGGGGGVSCLSYFLHLISTELLSPWITSKL